jgi:putative ABC transport system permease protein
MRRVAVVNQAFAAWYLGSDNPIGLRVRLADLENFPDRVPDGWFEIVGVVNDAKNQGLQLPAQPEVWVACTVTGSGQRGILVRTKGDPTMLLNDVRRAVWATDRSVALTYTGTLENFLNIQSYAGPKVRFRDDGAVRRVGLILVVTGVYSVVPYWVARRSHELGIRMALGATRSSAVRLVLSLGLRVIAIGVVLGLGASLVMSRIITSQLWPVSPYDPIAIAGVAAILMLTGTLACVAPARRATGIEPVQALRHD